MSSPDPTPAPVAPAAAPKRSRSLLLRALALVLVLAGIAWALWYWFDGRWYEATDDAYASGNVVAITPQTVGTVVMIGADDGDLVQAGDALVRLDPSDADVALAAARAELAATVRRVRGLYADVGGQAAIVASRETQLAKARADFRRREGLAASGAVSAEELAHARDALEDAESALVTARQQYRSSKVLVDDTVVASHPDVQAAAAKLRAALLDDARTTLVAPVTGYVAKRSVQVGQRVAPGTALMAVVPLNEVWIDANFKETQLTHMRLGQPVTLRADVYGSAVTYRGKVESLGIGTGSVFSLLPAQNATGNWIKIVQRIPVRITLDDPGQLDAHPLRLGMSMAVEVSLHDQSGPMLAAKAPQRPALATDVYRRQLADADAEIARIVHRNTSGDGKPAHE